MAPLKAARTSAHDRSKKRPYASMSRTSEYTAAPTASSRSRVSLSLDAASRKICGYLDAGFKWACSMSVAAKA
jgi:hypothetical protein